MALRGDIPYLIHPSQSRNADIMGINSLILVRKVSLSYTEFHENLIKALPTHTRQKTD